AYLQMAQDRAARAVVDRLPAAVARFDATATAGGAAPPLAGFYALAAIPARSARRATVSRPLPRTTSLDSPRCATSRNRSTRTGPSKSTFSGASRARG